MKDELNVVQQQMQQMKSTQTASLEDVQAQLSKLMSEVGRTLQNAA
jgi:hypothetical protein